MAQHGISGPGQHRAHCEVLHLALGCQGLDLVLQAYMQYVKSDRSDVQSQPIAEVNTPMSPWAVRRLHGNVPYAQVPCA